MRPAPLPRIDLAQLKKVIREYQALVQQVPANGVCAAIELIDYGPGRLRAGMERAGDAPRGDRVE